MKSVTWRIVGVGILGGVTYAFTKSVSQTMGVTLVFHGIRLVLYYWHERVWERIEWGRIRHPLAHFQVRADLSHEDHDVIRKFLEDQKFVQGRPEYEI